MVAVLAHETPFCSRSKSQEEWGCRKDSDIPCSPASQENHGISHLSVSRLRLPLATRTFSTIGAYPRLSRVRLGPRFREI